VASDTGTLALVASSYSISAVMCRSPLPNRIQPSAMRCRVGRKPTSRSMDFTSCHGQPVSVERAVGLASRPGLSIVLVYAMRDGVMARLGFPLLYSGAIVAFVTYAPEDATPSQQHWGNSNLVPSKGHCCPEPEVRAHRAAGAAANVGFQKGH